MFACLLAAALTFSSSDASSAFQLTREFVRDYTPRDAGTIRGRLAANFILDKASSRGADVKVDRFSVDTPKGIKWMTNLSTEFCIDKNLPWVVIASHYDTKLGLDCPGANDGASTTSLLISLCGVLSDWRTPKGNILLLWLDGEECYSSYSKNDGLWGSRRAAEQLASSGKNVQAVICVDMLGDKDLQISLPENSSPALRKIVHYAAKKLGNESKVKDIKELVQDDHVPFLEKGFKAINLIDFEYGSAPGLNDYWHTSKDTIDKLSVESFHFSGQLLTEMLNILL